MTTEQPQIFLPETARSTTTDETFAATIEGNDDATETVMDDYPEYWIG